MLTPVRCQLLPGARPVLIMHELATVAECDSGIQHVLSLENPQGRSHPRIRRLPSFATQGCKLRISRPVTRSLLALPCSFLVGHRRLELRTLPSASSDRQSLHRQLLLDHLPSAQLLLFVHHGLAYGEHRDIRDRRVQILQLRTLVKLLWCGLHLVGAIEVIKCACGADGWVGEAHACELRDAFENL